MGRTLWTGGAQPGSQRHENGLEPFVWLLKAGLGLELFGDLLAAGVDAVAVSTPAEALTGPLLLGVDSAVGVPITVLSRCQRFDLKRIPAKLLAEHFGAQFSLPQKTLKHLFNMVHFSMAQQDIRYYLNGLLLVVDGKNVIAVATDGHRLAFSQIVTDQEFARQEVIIPRKTIMELQRLLEDNDDPVSIAIATNQVKFNFSDIELISKLVEGKFPDYTRVIPKAYKNNFTIGRELLLRSLQRAAIMTSDKFKGVRCVIAPGSLKISSTNADQEEAVEELEIDYGGDSIDIGFNVTYLLDVLNNLKCDSVSVSLGDANSSALITLPDDANFKYVVMPMRI